MVKAAQGGKNLGRAINYAARDGQMSGKDCSDNPEEAKAQMQTTKEQWGKTEGRQYKHYIQSFAPGETNREQAHEIGLKWAEKNFQGYEVVVGTHADKEHIHNHIIVNSVNFESGRKIQVTKKDLEHFKSVSDELCRENGLSTIDRTQKCDRGEVRVYEMGKYQAMAQGKSYVVKTARTVQAALETAQSKNEFIRYMNDNDYRVDWQDNRKHITFTDRNGNKVRAANLEKTFSDSAFGKEGILQRLQLNRKMQHPQQQKQFKVQTVDEIKQNLAQIGSIGTQAGQNVLNTLSTAGKAIESAGKVVQAIPIPIIAQIVGGSLKATGKTVQKATDIAEKGIGKKQGKEKMPQRQKERSPQKTADANKAPNQNQTTGTLRARIVENEASEGTALDRRIAKRSRDIEI
ncbi:relaxase/mobilization nuclease domain-containing protein [Anaerospora hongkongensis]|uniref:relaxase/mobilization nuclease domain-containing protein n=1 Tax=Anaerospora hongkongensis TaxID=244830 RepID=UPI002896C2C0|nr:relaxase/mobilization nuclease domain-containing protein [Anaerospora hongkongensis]